ALQRSRGQRPDFVLLVEQPPHEIVEWKLGIGQLLRLHRSAEDRDVRPIGMIEARMQPLAAFLALGQMLKQQTARMPIAVALLRREPDQARNLLGLREIALRRLAQVLALEQDDALVAL